MNTAADLLTVYRLPALISVSSEGRELGWVMVSPPEINIMVLRAAENKLPIMTINLGA